MQLDMFAQPPQRRTSLESVVRESFSRAAADSLDIGRALTRQRASLGDDNFLKWVRDELGMTVAAADEYQRLAEIYPDASAVPADALGDLVAAIWDMPSCCRRARTRVPT